MIIKELSDFYQLLKPHHPIMAIDHGQKKCGIAISNPELTVAMPIKLISSPKLMDKIIAILEVVNKYDIVGIIIGLPLNMDGSLGEQSNIVMKFANMLEKNMDLPIYLQDERLTSRAADNLLKSIGLNRKERSNKDDALAASLILETALMRIRNMRG